VTSQIESAADALLPSEGPEFDVASELYAAVVDAPIISPHGHVDPRLLLDDTAFSDPADLLLTKDHYVTRLLHASGVGFAQFGRDPDFPADPREAWRMLASRWHLFAGTASGYWIERELDTLFGISDELHAGNADSSYDTISAALATPRFRPRALFSEFAIEVLATTDDPLDDLAVHRELAHSGVLTGRVLPTFRPDAYLDPDDSSFEARVGAVLDATGRPGTLAGYLQGLADRRQYFIENGAVSADHSPFEPFTADLSPSDGERLFARALAGGLDPHQLRLLRGHFLFQMARMSAEDGLVMTLHPGLRRNHHIELQRRYGADAGHDIPVRLEYTENLRSLLNAFGTDPHFHLVLFAVDETVYSREIAPLAGFYPSVYIGAPWWYLDAPDAHLRFRAAVTETAGFYRSSGFIDDTRAFLSIPARHDMSRRLDASFLARLVLQGRVRMRTARRIAQDLVDAIPKAVFKL
jgi:glucuronate isomerase